MYQAGCCLLFVHGTAHAGRHRGVPNAGGRRSVGRDSGRVDLPERFLGGCRRDPGRRHPPTFVPRGRSAARRVGRASAHDADERLDRGRGAIRRPGQRDRRDRRVAQRPVRGILAAMQPGERHRHDDDADPGGDGRDRLLGVFRRGEGCGATAPGTSSPSTSSCGTITTSPARSARSSSSTAVRCESAEDDDDGDLVVQRDDVQPVRGRSAAGRARHPARRRGVRRAGRRPRWGAARAR